MISGGGTGGHIFPAIAIANALKAICQNVDILFVGAKGRMEMEKVPAAGYRIEGLNIAGIQRRLTWKNLVVVFKIISSLRKAKKLIRDFKPHVAVGTGGYASGPTLRVASGMKIPTLIQEQNSYPGITNRILSRKVDKICVAYEGMEKYFPAEKIFLTGNPVRQDIVNLEGKRERGLEFFGLHGNRKTILVIGGSLGARTINESIEAGLGEFVKSEIQLLWQTGKLYAEKAKNAASQVSDSGIKAFDFISRMDYAYAVADVVVSRAGAASVSELCVVRKPAILVPSPNVAEDHQTKNAMALVSHNAALLVTDAEAKQKLCSLALELVRNESQRHRLEENIAALAFRNAAEVIANEVVRLGNTKLNSEK